MLLVNHRNAGDQITCYSNCFHGYLLRGKLGVKDATMPAEGQQNPHFFASRERHFDSQPSLDYLTRDTEAEAVQALG
jgi:hypothetical protein